MSAIFEALLESVTGGERGWIYRSPELDLAQVGYVLEEYFVTGEANSYRLVPGSKATFDGNWQTEVDASSRYKTRVFLLRPKNPEDYNGVLLAHWQNVSAGYENGLPEGEEIFSGYAWLAVSAQYDGIYGTEKTEPFGLRHWDKTRYGCLEHPGDGFSYDIFAQSVAALLESEKRGDRGPMGKLRTDKVIAVGGSQSAVRLASYINIAHQHHNIFDGFLLLVHFGLAFPVQEMPLWQLFDALSGGAKAHRHQIHITGEVKVMVLNSQAEALMHARARQPNSDNYHLWEMAGAAHTPPSTIRVNEVTKRRDSIPVESAQGQNMVEWGYIKDAAIRALSHWIRSGESPKNFEPILVDNDAYVTDDLGNIKGGIRLPEVNVPFARHSAGLPPNLLGETKWLSAEQIKSLHQSETLFLEKWYEALAQLAQEGLLTEHQEKTQQMRGKLIWQGAMTPDGTEAKD